MRLAILLLIALLPTAAFGQAQFDLEQDYNCSDFESRTEAQGYYLAMQIFTGEEDHDRLDANGDGQACEGIDVIRTESVLDTTATFNTKERLNVITCIDTSFTWSEFVETTRAAIYSGEGDHKGWHTMQSCVELHAALSQ